MAKLDDLKLLPREDVTRDAIADAMEEYAVTNGWGNARVVQDDQGGPDLFFLFQNADAAKPTQAEILGEVSISWKTGDLVPTFERKT